MNDIKSDLMRVLESDFPNLAWIGPDRAFDSLSSMCSADGKPITVEQMLRYAVVLENDLEHDSLL